MNSKKDIEQVIENFIQEERKTTFNPFISTRIMGVIEHNNYSGVKHPALTWKAAVVAFSLIAALFAGIATGGLYESKNETVDVVLINDYKMENFGFYVGIENE